MNKKIVFGLGLLLMPMGALLLTACGPAEDIDNAEIGLDEASDQYMYPQIPFSEYGLCNDGWDNDGNGLSDMADPACHVLGPVRDLSVYPAPLGNNFAPDISQIPPGGPGVPGGFRDRDQITRWMRFLTGTNGYTAGIDLFNASMDSPAVPVPAPLYPKVLQGTAAQGNNNNIDGIAIPGNALLPPQGAVLPAQVNNISDAYSFDMPQSSHQGAQHQNCHSCPRAGYGNAQGALNKLGGRSNMLGYGAQRNSFYNGNNPNNFATGQQDGRAAYGDHQGVLNQFGGRSNMSGYGAQRNSFYKANNANNANNPWGQGAR